MNIHDLAGEKKKRWEALLAELDGVREAYRDELQGAFSPSFAAMYGFLTLVCTLARAPGIPVTCAMTYSAVTDRRGTSGRLSLTLFGSGDV